jgi:cell division protease FtsH
LNTPLSRNIGLWLLLLLFGLLLLSIWNRQPTTETEITFSAFVKAVDEGKVANVVIQGKDITGQYKATEDAGQQSPRFTTYTPDYPDLVGLLRTKGVEIRARKEDDEPWYLVALVQWAPMLLLIGVWVFFMRQMQAGGGKAMSFGKSRAKLLTENQQKVTFLDVAGVEEAKEELEEIIAFLKDPKKFTKLGGRIPKGVLLVGPPGTGKTLLARAIAGEAGVPFFSISGSDFVEMFVGVGASRVRDLFIQGKKNAPCIVFIDEIDAVGRHRGAGLGGGHDEREQTLNQLLVEMDGFETNEGVILVAATNRPDVLDPALLRPGRFDRRVVVPRPDIRGREGILKVHVRRVPLAEDVNVEVLARQTPGFAGADLENLVNEAALLAARKNKERVEMNDFELAKDKVLMGPERRSMIISDRERRNTAFHEAGHALVAKLVPAASPVHKVTIIPRGMALGVTHYVPADDQYSFSRDQFLAAIAVAFGGRVAEELVLHETTTGAKDDIEKATEMARNMVCKYGMSDKLGPLSFGGGEEEIFLGRDFTKRAEYSEATAVQIDSEVRRIVLDCFERAKLLLRRNFEALHKLAETLLERETLDGAEVDEIVRLHGSQNGDLRNAAAASA